MSNATRIQKPHALVAKAKRDSDRETIRQLLVALAFPTLAINLIVSLLSIPYLFSLSINLFLLSIGVLDLMYDHIWMWPLVMITACSIPVFVLLVCLGLSVAIASKKLAESIFLLKTYLITFWIMYLGLHLWSRLFYPALEYRPPLLW